MDVRRARWHASITDEWLHLVVDDISIAPVAARLLRGTSADSRCRRRRPLSLGVGRPSRSRPAKGRCAVNGCWSRCRQKADHKVGGRSRPEARLRYDNSMLQALRPEDALTIAEVSRRRSRDEQAMAQYLGVGRGARANGAPPDGTLLRLPGDVDLAAFESEERRSLEAAIARLSPDARRELIALIGWYSGRY